MVSSPCVYVCVCESGNGRVCVCVCARAHVCVCAFVCMGVCMYENIYACDVVLRTHDLKLCGKIK